jgi:hypothetical protein
MTGRNGTGTSSSWGEAWKLFRKPTARMPTRCAAAPARCGSSQACNALHRTLRPFSTSRATATRISFADWWRWFSPEALKTDARAVFAEFGLKEHLTPQRSNGFSSMVERIMSDARAQLGA